MLIAERVNAIIAAEAVKQGVSVGEDLGDRRLKQFVAARHVAMWRVRREMGLSYPRIARLFNRGDHTTVIDAVRKIDKKIETIIEKMGRP